MRPHTSGRARTSRSQGTRGRQPSATLTSSVPSTFESSTSSGTYESQSSTGSLPIPAQFGQAETPNLTQHELYVPTEEESDEESVDPGSSSQPSGHIGQLKFPYQLYKMINDPRMGKYIRWDGPDVFQVLGIDPFVKKALPKYFPRQKTWGSFQKQLKNYGLETQSSWGSSQPKFAHWNRKFCQDREDLLGEVVKQHTAPTPQALVPAQTPIHSTPSFPGSIPQPSGQVDLKDRVSQLEYLVLQLTVGCTQQSAKESRLLEKEKRLFATEKRLLSRERRLLTRETRLFAKEKRLVAKERQFEAKGKDLLARERQLEQEFQSQESASEQPAISTEIGSSYLIDQTGSAEAAIDQDSHMCDEGEFHDARDEITWNSETGTTDGSDVQDPFPYPETEITFHTPDSAPFVGQPPQLQTPGSPLPTSSSYANDQQDSIEYHPGSHEFDENLAAWYHSHFNPLCGIFWQNSSTTAPTSPPPVSAQTASGPGSRYTSVAQVPPLGSSRCWGPKH